MILHQPGNSERRDAETSRKDLIAERDTLEALNAPVLEKARAFAPEVFGGLRATRQPQAGVTLHLDMLLFTKNDLKSYASEQAVLAERLSDPEFRDQDFSLEPASQFGIQYNIGSTSSPEGIAVWRMPERHIARAFVLVSRKRGNL